MRKSLVVFGLLAILSLFGGNAAQACGGWWAPAPCCFVASPCCYYVPACCEIYCCGPCCDWSCCCYGCTEYRCYGVVPSQVVSGCSSCAPAAASPSGGRLMPIPDKNAASPNQ